MQSGKSGLKIHTRIMPEETVSEEKKSARALLRFKLPKITLKNGRRRRTIKKRLVARRTPAERLLRNTSIACTIVMCVMALASLDTPWSKKAVRAVSDAVTMSVNLDDTLGRLNFVREWMPEAALVFWNMGTENALARPVSGALTHGYNSGQPWLEYQTKGEQPVYAVADGRVAAVMANSNGEWTLMIDHDDDEQTVYAYLGKSIVKSGQSVIKGSQIAITSNDDASRLYFEMRKNGEPIDPTDRMSGS